jgi:5-(carboxyamino)imidazole ribonucleotide synthase
VRTLAARVPVFPPQQALAASQDRLVEKSLFPRLGVPTAVLRADRYHICRCDPAGAQP